MNHNVLIVGASSGIAEAVARRYAAEHANLFLVARNDAKLQVINADLMAKGASKVETFVLDANDSTEIPIMLNAAWKAFQYFDVALVAHGTLPDQSRTETDIPYAITEFRTNAESVIACLVGLGQKFELQKKGSIAVIGSVAGDRGRGSNYLYGAAKAAIDTYAAGMRARLSKLGVHVMTIKPGFVATPMTASIDLPAKLTVTPDHVAKDILAAIAKQKNVLYTPWFWSLIMLIIRSIPEPIFKKLKL